MTSQRKKETFFGYKKHNFSKSKKKHFSKRVNSWFWQKKGQFFSLFRFGQNKTRNNAQCSIMLSNGLIQALDQKMPNSSLFRFGHKTRYNA